MKMVARRSLECLVDEQIAKWERLRMAQKKKPEPYRPCIAISREPGSGGTKVARWLAKDLGMDIVGKTIIQQVAECANISERVIASLDEKEVRRRDSWIDSMFETRHIWPDKYLRYLARVIGTIGKQGNAIIIGRGGQFILPPEETFRVRLFAPREVRIRNVMQDSSADFENAERYVCKTEADRNAFNHQHFRADGRDPANYDLIVNTGSLGIEGAAAVVKTAFVAWKKHRQTDSECRRQ